MYLATPVALFRLWAEGAVAVARMQLTCAAMMMDCAQRMGPFARPALPRATLAVAANDAGPIPKPAPRRARARALALAETPAVAKAPQPADA